MKTTLLSFIFSLLAVGAYSQIVISEIMYNPPESGGDSLEYLELTNISDVPVSLEGYSFSDGIEYEFPSIVLFEGSQLVLAVDSAAYESVFGGSARQWTDGALSNGGEQIVLIDSDSSVVDEVDFDDNAPWPSSVEGTDGGGASIELCDLTSDNNLGESWRAASNNLGVVINGNELRGTPGADNSVVCDTTPVDIPSYDIGLVTTVDSEGVGDSLGTICKLTGVVHSLNFRPGGYTFIIIDALGDGINVFADQANLTYEVQEGDEIEVTGGITQFSGLLQIVPTEIAVLSTDQALVTPTEVTMAIGEEHESQLIVINGVELETPADWAGDGSSFNVTFGNGDQSYTVRIDSDTELSTMEAPAAGTIWNITGVGGQFDPSNPFDEGYQLLPRRMTDLELITSTQNIFDESQIATYPNPAQDVLYWESEEQIEVIRFYDIMGKEVIRQIPNAANGTVATEGLAPGMYLGVWTGQNASLTRKIQVR